MFCQIFCEETEYPTMEDWAVAMKYREQFIPVTISIAKMGMLGFYKWKQLCDVRVGSYAI